MPSNTSTTSAVNENTLILQSIDLGTSFGVAYIAVAISATLYGVTCCQTFYYYRMGKGSSDPWYIRISVPVLLILDTIHEAIVIYCLYFYLITEYAHASALLIPNWSIPVSIILLGIIEVIVESILALRVWNLGHNIYLSMLCNILVLARFVSNITYSVKFFPLQNVQSVQFEDLKTYGIIVLVVGAVTDVIISISILVYLARSRTGFRRSDDIITKLMVLTMSTGTLTSIFVAVNLVTLVLPSNVMLAVAFNFLRPKLYINSFMTALNIRDTILGVGRDTTTEIINSIPLSVLERGGGQTYRGPFEFSRTVQIYTVTEKDARASAVPESVAATSVDNSANPEVSLRPAPLTAET